MIRHGDDPLQAPRRRRRTTPPKTSKALLTKIRMGLWRQEELEWLLRYLGPALTPAVATEIRAKLQALQAEKGVH